MIQIEKYQEQGQLLEPHLEGLITPLMGIVRVTVAEADGGKLGKAEMLVCQAFHDKEDFKCYFMIV